MSDGTDDGALGWAIEVDRDVCMGSGVCLVYAPRTFAQDQETKAVVIDPRGDPSDIIRTAVAACPSGALRLIPCGGGEPAN